MKIYSMTATFGKLEHQTLNLTPEMNVIEHPNEWGKSTWCAFILAMLYGIDTRQQTTKDVLADKERYRPWSGTPMSGRMELNWNGRDITIERSTKGRIPMGEFQAYETQSGLPVPELTAANCGLQLLGVERSVFARAGFIRMQDMAVSQDEAFRRRLNSLVTTGDESGAGDRLGKQLRELQNKCRYNRNGLLPQAENERDQLRSQLQRLEQLTQELQQMRIRQKQLERNLKLLRNHETALRYTAAIQGAERVAQAQQAQEETMQQLSALQSQCDQLPDAQTVLQKLKQGQQLQLQEQTLRQQQEKLPQPPDAPVVAACYQGVSSEAAISAAKEDAEHYRRLTQAGKKQARVPFFYALAAVMIIAGAVLCAAFLPQIASAVYIGCGSAVLLGGIITAVLCICANRRRYAQLEELTKNRPGIPVGSWVEDAREYALRQQQYRDDLLQHNTAVQQLETQQQTLRDAIRAYCGEQSLTDAIAHWERAAALQQQLADKQRQAQSICQHAQDLQALTITAPEPEFEDELTLTQQETDAQIQSCLFEQRQLQFKTGQYQGQIESIGDGDVLKARLDGVERRISRLENHYRALELAQDALYKATNELQRRFAPRISKRAQSLFCRMTDGKYARFVLSGDLSIQTAAEQEDTMRSAQWRSDGTADQLYFALRLAVAGEITPDAPLILDDALVRFDDQRLKSALDILKEEAANKQVILFTCQGREQTMLNT